MISAPATENNVNLVRAVNTRIRSDAVMLSAQAAMWRFSGIGILLVSAGIAIAAVLFGYSYVNDSRTSVEKMAAAIAAALEGTTVGMKGNVDLTPGGVVTLEPGGKVEVSGGTVEMVPGEVTFKPGGKVEVSGGSRVEPSSPSASPNTRPTPDQFFGTPNPAQPASKVVTNFTVFKQVSYGKGTVVSGWQFSSNEDPIPNHQSCYYSEEDTTKAPRSGTSGAVESVVWIARNGQLSVSALGNEVIDVRAAATHCVWFNGRPTIAASASQGSPSQGSPSQNGPSPLSTEDPATLDSWCLQVKQPSSIALCSDAELRLMALQRNKLFELARAKLSSGDYEALFRNQKEWVRSQSRECSIMENVPLALPLTAVTLSCLKRAGSARIAFLKNQVGN